MNTIIGAEPTLEAMFNIMDGWTSQFNVDGINIGGKLALDRDSRLAWHLKILGGIEGKRVLELGPLEGAHTKMMIESGAREIIAVEGLSDCFLRCLIVKEAFGLDKARFIFADFCRYVESYCGEDFDVVTALGVLYHQSNPAKLIHDLARITSKVIVWSQVASAEHPGKIESSIDAYGQTYFGKIMNWGNARLTCASYCASLNTEAFWMYPAEMLRCFKDAGFIHITSEPQSANDHGECLLFVASKNL